MAVRVRMSTFLREAVEVELSPELAGQLEPLQDMGFSVMESANTRRYTRSSSLSGYCYPEVFLNSDDTSMTSRCRRTSCSERYRVSPDWLVSDVRQRIGEKGKKACSEKGRKGLVNE